MKLKLKDDKPGLNALLQVFPNAEKFNEKINNIDKLTGIRFSINKQLVNPEDINSNKFDVSIYSSILKINDECDTSVFTIEIFDDKKIIEITNLRKYTTSFGEVMEGSLTNSEKTILFSWLKEKFAPYAEKIA